MVTADDRSTILKKNHKLELGSAKLKATSFDKDQVTMTDDREHRTSFYTDGRKIEKQKDPDIKEVSARWDDKKLVTDEKGSHNGKVTRTFELSSDGKQLVETIHVTDSKGNHPINVQYVYDAARENDRYAVN